MNVTSTTAPYTEMSAMGGSAGPITDGWRFETVLDITNADRYFRVLFIGGEDCEVDCLGTKTLSAVIDTATDVTEPGFEPDIVFFGSSHVSTDGYTLTDDANMSTGIAFNDTANRNKGLSYFAEHNIGTTDNTMVQWSNGVGGLLDGTTTKVYGIDIDNYDSNGFDVSPRGAGGQSDYFGYLAMRDKTGTSNYWLDDINSPNNTTVDWDTYNTTLGFQPTLLMIWGLNTYLEDTINDAIAYSKGYYLADADTVMTMNQHNEDDSAWSDVGNETDSGAFLTMYWDHGANKAHQYENVTFTANGFKVEAADITTAGAVHKWMAFAFAPGPANPILANTRAQMAPILMR